MMPITSKHTQRVRSEHTRQLRKVLIERLRPGLRRRHGQQLSSWS